MLKRLLAAFLAITLLIPFVTTLKPVVTNSGTKVIRLNQGTARRYFEEAMQEFEMDYHTTGFSTVNTGGLVPRGARAMAPGYLASVEVKVLDAHVPLIGPQEVWIPMRYFAVVKSERI